MILDFGIFQDGTVGHPTCQHAYILQEKRKKILKATQNHRGSHLYHRAEDQGHLLYLVLKGGSIPLVSAASCPAKNFFEAGGVTSLGSGNDAKLAPWSWAANHLKQRRLF